MEGPGGVGPRRRSSGASGASALFLVLVLALSACRRAEALVCESYKAETECEGTVTSEGSCGWKDGACTALEGLGEGMVGVTGIGVVDNPGGEGDVQAQEGGGGPQEAIDNIKDYLLGLEGGQDSGAFDGIVGARVLLLAGLGAIFLLQTVV